MEGRIAELTLIAKYADTYQKCHPIYDRYKQSGDKEKYLRGHESEIILFEAAARELKQLGAVPLPSMDRVQAELAELTARKNTLYADYSEAKRQIREYETIRQNLDILFRCIVILHLVNLLIRLSAFLIEAATLLTKSVFFCIQEQPFQERLQCCTGLWGADKEPYIQNQLRNSGRQFPKSFCHCMV